MYIEALWSDIDRNFVSVCVRVCVCVCVCYEYVQGMSIQYYVGSFLCIIMCMEKKVINEI